VSKRAIGILTNSSAEVSITAARLNVSKEKIRYVPMHTNIETPAMSSTDEGFILSAGRTLRDYAVLLKVAPQLNMPIHIICGANDILIHPLPKNITIHKDIAYDDYLDYLKRCSFMVLPLLPTMRSTGQVVMFEAMAFGKPVIASESPGTVDYIEHDRNGLLIEGSNAIDLAAACNRLIHDIRLRQHLGQQSLQSILGKHLIETHARHKLHAIHELLSALQFNSILAQRR
ncbi:MAG: glycosyltransferase, partial [Verrucomicrobiae bacterium]|nr:glycosyltransferase [Verrucomicrobiae bacterium]